jgi:hypothetical protein
MVADIILLCFILVGIDTVSALLDGKAWIAAFALMIMGVPAKIAICPNVIDPCTSPIKNFITAQFQIRP